MEPKEDTSKAECSVAIKRQDITYGAGPALATKGSQLASPTPPAAPMFVDR